MLTIKIKEKHPEKVLTRKMVVMNNQYLNLIPALSVVFMSCQDKEAQLEFGRYFSFTISDSTKPITALSYYTNGESEYVINKNKDYHRLELYNLNTGELEHKIPTHLGNADPAADQRQQSQQHQRHGHRTR